MLMMEPLIIQSFLSACISTEAARRARSRVWNGNTTQTVLFLPEWRRHTSALWKLWTRLCMQLMCRCDNSLSLLCALFLNPGFKVSEILPRVHLIFKRRRNDAKPFPIPTPRASGESETHPMLYSLKCCSFFLFLNWSASHINSLTQQSLALQIQWVKRQ